MTISAQGSDVARRLAALAVLGAALAGPPVALWQLGGLYLPDELPSWTEVSGAVSGPDTGAVFLGLLVVIGWLAWASFAMSVAVELVGQIRRRPPLRLPGLAGPQQLAGLLVAAVLGVGTGPLLVAPALAGTLLVAEQPVDHAESGTPPVGANAPPATPTAAGPMYTVQPRDTLGRIAARYLGDWSRFQEVLDLNRGRPQPDGAALTDPGLIRPGWVLVLPPDADPPAPEPTAGQVTVRPGDTLTDIAEQNGLDSWQPIFDLNVGELQPGGGNFTDPDLLRPGQVLDLPQLTPTAPRPSGSGAPPADVPPQDVGESPQPIEPRPTPTTTPPSAPAAAEGSREPVEPSSPGADHDESPSSLAAVLAGSGALMAAGVGAAWLAHRRQRLHERHPGRRLASPPPALLTTHKTVSSAADVGTADYVALDRALRGLALQISDDSDGRLPDVVAARLDSGRLDLRLRVAAGQPPPGAWTVDDTRLWWSLQLDEDADVDDELAGARLAPFPTLVTIGSDSGQRWLLDLECLGAVYVAGSAARGEDFARHVAAELAVNSWSDLLTVTTVGFGEELVDLAPHRVRPVAADSGVLAAVGEAARDTQGVLEGRLRAGAGDGWMPHVVLAPYALDRDGSLSEVAAVVRGRGQRGAVALVVGAGLAPDADEWSIRLTDAGRLHIPALELNVLAPYLTVQQARDIAALLAFERDSGDEPIPAADGERPWQRHTDAAGALRQEVSVTTVAPPASDLAPTVAPRLRASDVEGDGALVSAPDGHQRDRPLAEAAKLAGRSASADLRRRIESDLDALDHDIADWWSPDCTRPRLTLFGPVTLRAHGDERAVAKSGLRRRYEETVAYLATRPHGATVDEAATALQPARGGKTDPVSARAYVHRVTAGARAWLGTDPTTGEKHLSSGHRGRYTLTNLLVDADLFRQLRVRAEVRGSEGTADLLAALRLVSGPPFAQRPTGYEWLDGLDMTLTAAVCDVAHHVVSSALVTGDLSAASAAAATALLVAPDDEQVLLDAMWVSFHRGDRAEAETHVVRIVQVHDGADEMDLPMSTAETINRARREFLGRAS